MTGATIDNSVTFQRGISWVKNTGGASDIPGELYDHAEANLVAYHENFFGTIVFIVANGPNSVDSHSHVSLHYSTVCFTGSNWTGQKLTANGPGNANANTLSVSSTDWTRAFIYATRRSTTSTAQDYDLAVWPKDATTINYQYGADSANSGGSNSLIAWAIENTGGGMYTHWVDHANDNNPNIDELPQQWFGTNEGKYEDGDRWIGLGTAGVPVSMVDIKPDMLSDEGGGMINMTRSDATNNSTALGSGVAASRYEFDATSSSRGKLIIPFAFGTFATQMEWLFGAAFISFSETEDPSTPPPTPR